jgi:hypothetical protein
VTGIEPKSAPNGGYTRVRRTEGLLRSVIGAVVQGTRRRENPFPWMRPWVFSGWSPEAVQFFKGIQADSTKAYQPGGHLALLPFRSCADPR